MHSFASPTISIRKLSASSNVPRKGAAVKRYWSLFNSKGKGSNSHGASGDAAEKIKLDGDVCVARPTILEVIAVADICVIGGGFGNGCCTAAMETGCCMDDIIAPVGCSMDCDVEGF